MVDRSHSMRCAYGLVHMRTERPGVPNPERGRLMPDT